LRPSAPKGFLSVFDAGVLEESFRENRVLSLEDHGILALRQAGSIGPTGRYLGGVSFFPIELFFFSHARKE